MAVGDFLVMWCAEFVLHHLDILVGVPDRPAPLSEAIFVATLTMDGLLSAPRVGRWDETTYLMKVTGRVPLTDGERQELGAAAAKVPVIG